MHTPTHAHTWTDNASILGVATNWGGVIGTVHKPALIPCASHIVQEDGPLPPAKECPPQSNSICRFSAEYRSVLWIIMCMLHTGSTGIIIGDIVHVQSVLNPSCRHATAASVLSQKSSHTVPAQILFWQTSSVPSLSAAPPTNRISPS